MGYEKIKTTQDLKKYPVEFHILPNCDKSSCQGSNRYYNDDGISVGTKPNIYQLIYYADIGGDVSFIVYQYETTIIDANDVLGGLHIYNAAAMDLTGSYTAVVTLFGGATSFELGTTEPYNADTDKLVWIAAKDQEPVNLPEIDKITIKRNV